MKKKVLSLILAGSMILSMAACGNNGGTGEPTGLPTEPVSQDTFTGDGSEIEGGSSSELVDGRFAETRHITVEVYDRGNDGGSDPTNNMYTDYIKAGMLADHNVEVEFVAVPRWTEVEEINNLLAAGTAPDICLTYSYPTIQTYADMGGVIDLQNYVVDYKNDIPNLCGTGSEPPTCIGTRALPTEPFGLLKEREQTTTVLLLSFVRTGLTSSDLKLLPPDRSSTRCFAHSETMLIPFLALTQTR